MELIDHNMWWEGPEWLRLPSCHWPDKYKFQRSTVPDEEKQVACLVLSNDNIHSLIPLDRYSKYSCFIRITAWVLRFIHHCRTTTDKLCMESSPHLNASELHRAEIYWFSLVQWQYYLSEIVTIKFNSKLSRSSSILSLHPFLDEDGLLRVGGHKQHSCRSYSLRQPIILNEHHLLSKLLVCSEHLRLLHAGPTLLSCSLNRCVHIVGGCKVIRSITLIPVWFANELQLNRKLRCLGNCHESM